jgi:hypothetical protein
VRGDVGHDIRRGHELVCWRRLDERKGKRSYSGLRSVHTPASRGWRKKAGLLDTGSWWQARTEESRDSGTLQAIRNISSYVKNINMECHGVVATILLLILMECDSNIISDFTLFSSVPPKLISNCRSRGSSVSIVTRLRSERPGLDSRQG